MSAIFGILGPASRDELDAMAARMSHKGQFAYCWSPVENVWLGEIRDTPRQDDEPELAAFSGQLYLDWRKVPESEEFRAVDRDLFQRRRVADALQNFGINFTDSLDGYFGVAWWDDSARKLILSVDRINYENIYFSRTPDRFVFASEYKALLALEDVPARPDPDALQHSISTFLPNYDGSLCDGVGRVRYGHTLVVSADQQQLRQYFRPVCRPADGSLADFASGLRSQMLEQVRGMLGHQQRVAITLGGGLDSAGLLGMLRHTFPERTIASYTIGAGGDDPEIVGARAAAKSFSTEHHDFVFRPESLIDDLPKIIWLSEEFAAREESILQYQLESLIVGRENMLIGGHGADMIFGGMPRHRLIRMAETLPIARTGLTELYQQTQSGQRPGSIAGRLLSYLAYRGNNVPPPRLAGSSGPSRVFEPTGIAEMLNDLIGGFHPFHYHSPIYALAPIETFMPFMSRAVMDYSLRIPARYKVGLLRQKMVLREAMAPFLPDDIRKRPKAIQRAKRTEVLSDVLDTLARDLLSSADVRNRRLVDPAYVRKIRRRPASGIYAGDQLSRLWMLISSEMWCRTFVDNRGLPYGFSVDDDLRASTPPRLRGTDAADGPAWRRPLRIAWRDDPTGQHRRPQGVR
jgi:asparagine synthase (glutamine-hydrolysing)